MSFAAAGDTCRRYAAHLATITSAEEQAVVAPLVFRNLWLGGRVVDPTTRRVAWLTGEPYLYQRLGTGEPDDNGCLILAPSGIWHDRPCDRIDSALCEFEPGVPIAPH
jgi:hypothetical protein